MRRALLALAIVLALPLSAPAFVRSRTDAGACLFWDTRTIPWAMNERGLPGLGYERAHEAFARAFRTWEDVGCSDVTFEDRSPTSETRVGHGNGATGDNLMIFRTRDCDHVVPEDAPCRAEGGCANEFDCWEHGSSVIGVTTTTFFVQTGEIVDADIEMNAAWFDFTDVDGPPCEHGQTTGCVITDIQNTATHEIGHLLGLDHSPDRHSTMFASAPRGDLSKRDLGEDDVEGLCFIYPDGGPTARCTEADEVEAGAGCGCQGAAGAGDAALLLAAIALLGRARSRRGGGPSRG